MYIYIRIYINILTYIYNNVYNICICIYIYIYIIHNTYILYKYIYIHVPPSQTFHLQDNVSGAARGPTLPLNTPVSCTPHIFPKPSRCCTNTCAHTRTHERSYTYTFSSFQSMRICAGHTHIRSL